MPDLFNLIPGIGQLKGLLGPSVAETDSALMPAPDPTTILGVPLQALGTAGIGWGLGRLLTNKRNRQTGQLRGLQLGLGLGMAPIQQEQAQYDKTMQAALDKGLLTPYEAPANVMSSQWEQATPEQGLTGAAPMASTPTPVAPPSVNYGGMRLMVTPTVSFGDLYQDPKMSPAIAAMRARVTPSDMYNVGQLGIARTQEERAAQEAARQDQQRELYYQGAEAAGIPNARQLPIQVVASRLQRYFGTQDDAATLRRLQELAPGATFNFKSTPTGLEATTQILSPEDQVKQARTIAALEEQTAFGRERIAAEREQAKNQAEVAEARRKIEQLQSYQQALQTSATGIEEARKNLSVLQDQFGNPLPSKEAAHTAQMQKLFNLEEEHKRRVDAINQSSRKLLDIEEAPPPPAETEKDREARAKAEKAQPYLDRFLRGEPPDYASLPPEERENFAEAAGVYQEMTAEPLRYLQIQLGNAPGWAPAWLTKPPPNIVADMQKRFGPQPTEAAIRRWQNGGR